MKRQKQAIHSISQPLVTTTVHEQEQAARLEYEHVLDQLDLTQKLAAKKYKTELEKYQGKLNQLSREPGFRNISLLAVFEGPDAAGKGGAIRRVSAALDARQYNIVSVAAPSEEERDHP